jgi:hypothetical protein
MQIEVSVKKPMRGGRTSGIPIQAARSVCPVIGVVWRVPTFDPNPAVGSVALPAVVE